MVQVKICGVFAWISKQNILNTQIVTSSNKTLQQYENLHIFF